MSQRPYIFMAIVALLLRGGQCLADLRDDALLAARKAVAFYSQTVATEGGYLWRYSADLKLREGVTANTVWVQPCIVGKIMAAE